MGEKEAVFKMQINGVKSKKCQKTIIENDSPSQKQDRFL